MQTSDSWREGSCRGGLTGGGDKREGRVGGGAHGAGVESGGLGRRGSVDVVRGRAQAGVVREAGEGAGNARDDAR